VNRGIAAAHADGQQLGDLFGDGQKTRHGFERGGHGNPCPDRRR
jgi:hypothetical protein